MATEDQILLKLVIQGNSPEEINALANSTQGQLNAKIKGLIDQLTQTYRDAEAARTADAVAAAEKRKDVLEKQIEVIAKVQRANEIAANRATNAWKGTLEVMENIATSARFAYDVISGGFDRMVRLGDEIDRITNVTSALKGSIDEMREASRGQVSDFDLISTKNRALEKDLQLTDQQFGILAASADNFADAIGENTKEALNKLVDGLATGRVKMLEHIGVMVNADDAYKKYAKSIGVAGDQLSDHGKKVAIIQESLRLMDKKLAESGVAIENFSDKYEVFTAKLNNMWTDLLKTLGKIIVKAVEGFTIDLPDAIRLALAKIKDMMPGANGEAVAAVVAQHDKNLADFYGAEDAKKQQEKARARQEALDSYLYAGAGEKSRNIDDKKIAEDAKKAEAAADAIQKTIDAFDKMLRKGSGIDQQSLDTTASYVQSASESSIGSGYNPGASQFALSGRNNSTARTQALEAALARQQENIALSMEAPNESNDLSRGKDSKGAVDRMQKSLQAAQDRIDDLRKRAGGGILADALFGTDGPGGLKEKVDTFAESAADAVGMVTEAGKQMGAAMGQALAALVSGSSTKSLRQQTHDILEALAAQAYTQSIMKTAMGLASLGEGFMGNPAGFAAASQFFASAAMFAAVGTGAALSARGVGNDPKAAAATKSSTGSAASAGGIATTTSGTGGFGSNGVRSTNSNQNNQPITISMNVMPGGEAEAGRQINKALAAYYSQTGQGAPVGMVTA